MDTNCIKQLLDFKLLQTIYSKIFVIDLSARCCGEWVAGDNSIVNPQRYENWLISLAEKMYKSDSAAFFTKMDLNRICATITDTASRCTVYFRWEENACIQEFRLSICFADELHTHLLILQEDLLDNHPKALETMDELAHCNARFQFLVNHLISDCIEINIETGMCHMFPADSSMKACAIYEQQIAWWAEHIIVPEERDTYIKEYELGSLTRALRKSNGYHSATYTTFSGTTRNSILIISTLIKEDYGKSKEYIFAYAQDVTQFKAQESRNRQLVDISQQLLTLSQTEPVTGLYNRAACEKLVGEHLASTVKGVSGTMLLIDIDRFKEFNDQYGHSTGDFVLRFLGKTMHDIFRSDDIVCRWGGDEFVVFMRDVSDPRMIIGRIERLRAKLRQCKMDGRALPITVSIGGRVADQSMSLDVLFDYCDKSLYRVKAQGRNGFLICPELS